MLVAFAGKTAVVISLVASNPRKGTHHTAAELQTHFEAHESRYSSHGCTVKHKRLSLQATVVLTSVSLLGQWEDEIKKHAPALKVVRFHSNSLKQLMKKLLQNDALAFQKLSEADVIVSSSTFPWPRSIVNSFRFHRVVQDESHLFATAQVSANVEHALKIRGTRRWCVTATPMMSGLRELSVQAKFLEFEIPLLRTLRVVDKASFLLATNLLKKLMTRHTKSQRINGSSALALPSTTTTAVLITMDDKEKRLYSRAQKNASKQLNSMMRCVHTKAFPLQKVLNSVAMNTLLATPLL